MEGINCCFCLLGLLVIIIILFSLDVRYCQVLIGVVGLNISLVCVLVWWILVNVFEG